MCLLVDLKFSELAVYLENQGQQWASPSDSASHRNGDESTPNKRPNLSHLSLQPFCPHRS